MNYYSQQDRANEVYERVMEVIHEHVGDAIEGIEELGELAEELASESSRDRADELIDKIIRSLEKI